MNTGRRRNIPRYARKVLIGTAALGFRIIPSFEELVSERRGAVENNDREPAHMYVEAQNPKDDAKNDSKDIHVEDRLPTKGRCRPQKEHNEQWYESG